MLTSRSSRTFTSAMMAVLAASSTLISLTPAIAQLPPPNQPRWGDRPTYGSGSYNNRGYNNRGTYQSQGGYGDSGTYGNGYDAIPAGTQVPVRFDRAKKILVTPEETMPLTLKVASNIRDRSGAILVPAGSEISGRIEPYRNGSRFVAQTITIRGRKVPISAFSQVVVTTETIREGASTGDILKGTLAGAGAATLIAGLTGDRRIDALEVLAGAAVGTLAGWALPTSGAIGGGSKEVISINPNRDLTLTLDAPLSL